MQRMYENILPTDEEYHLYWKDGLHMKLLEANWLRMKALVTILLIRKAENGKFVV